MKFGYELMDTDELRDAISVDDALDTMQRGMIDELADIECELIRGQVDKRFVDLALTKVQRLKKELIQDLDNRDWFITKR